MSGNFKNRYEPTEDEINDTLEKLQARLDNEKLSPQVKEGYEEAEDILADDRRTYSGIDKLTSVQARAIAVLAVDYLNGECEAKVLLRVPAMTIQQKLKK